jgi:hypothetical protein
MIKKERKKCTYISLRKMLSVLEMANALEHGGNMNHFDERTVFLVFQLRLRKGKAYRIVPDDKERIRILGRYGSWFDDFMGDIGLMRQAGYDIGPDWSFIEEAHNTGNSTNFATCIRRMDTFLWETGFYSG